MKRERFESERFCRIVMHQLPLRWIWRSKCQLYEPPWLGNFFKILSAALMPFLYCFNSYCVYLDISVALAGGQLV